MHGARSAGERHSGQDTQLRQPHLRAARQSSASQTSFGGGAGRHGECPGLAPIVICAQPGLGGRLRTSYVREGKDAMEPGFAAPQIDTSKPHPARMYNAYLGGNDNYAADREAVRRILRDFPEVRPMALANRAFLRRAVRFLAGEAGIGQFIDIGTGIPSAGNVHEIAGKVAPGARVVYVDNGRLLSGYAHATVTMRDCHSVRTVHGCGPTRADACEGRAHCDSHAA
jgi:hypothetical protein